MVICHDDWSTTGFGRPPVAGLTGPFTRRPFLEALWNLDPAGDLCIAEGDTALVPLVTCADGWAWVGHGDLVDYRSPLGDGAADLISEVMAGSPSGRRYRFDSLPAEAADVVGRGLSEAGLGGSGTEHAVAACVPLPASYDDYLLAIGKKERHELRRKARRFAETHGTPMLTTEDGPGRGLDAFIAMHRQSPGKKGRFMNSSMVAWFTALAGQEGWRIDLLGGDDGVPVAATFGWADDRAYYLYNSAYDRRASGSPGMVLLSMLIERAIDTGMATFDFLKGDEPYKFRMGAVRRPLYVFEGTT